MASVLDADATFRRHATYIPKSKSGPARVDVLKNNFIRTHAGVPSRGDGQAHSRRRKEKVGVFPDPSAGAAKVF